MQDISIQNQNQTLVSAGFSGKPKMESHPTSFGQMLKRSMNEISRLQQEADASIIDLATGKATDIHQTMIAVEKASVSFELLMQIRNKIIAAYEQIMRTPI